MFAQREREAPEPIPGHTQRADLEQTARVFQCSCPPEGHRPHGPPASTLQDSKGDTHLTHTRIFLCSVAAYCVRKQMVGGRGAGQERGMRKFSPGLVSCPLSSGRSSHNLHFTVPSNAQEKPARLRATRRTSLTSSHPPGTGLSSARGKALCRQRFLFLRCKPSCFRQTCSQQQGVTATNSLPEFSTRTCFHPPPTFN